MSSLINYMFFIQISESILAMSCKLFLQLRSNFKPQLIFLKIYGSTQSGQETEIYIYQNHENQPNSQW